MQSLRLEFSHVGGRTQLVRRQFSWPFHVGRQFQEPDAPQAAVVVLQSASGTLNAGDRLRASLVVNDGAVVRVRAQGAPSVHRARDGQGVVEDTAIAVGHDGSLECLAEPRVLFPGARLSQTLTVDLAGTGSALLADGAIALHGGSGQGFEEFASELLIRRDGELLVHEQVRTGDWSRAPGRAGSFTAFGQVLILPGADRSPTALEWDDPAGYLAATTLPNGAGLLVRIAASGGRQLRACIDEMVTRCRATGTMPDHGAAATQS